MPKAYQDKEQNMLPFHKLKMAFSSGNGLNLSFDTHHQTLDFQNLMMYQLHQKHSGRQITLNCPCDDWSDYVLKQSSGKEECINSRSSREMQSKQITDDFSDNVVFQVHNK